MKARPITAESLKADTVPAWPWWGEDHELGQCWVATRGRFCCFGYCREDYRIAGLGNKTKRLTTHILAWLLDNLGPMGRDELYLAYVEFRASGLQIEHRCETPGCRRPSHLEPMTQSENIRASKERSYQRNLTRPPIEYEEEDEPLPF